MLEPWMTDLITSKGVAAAHAVWFSFRVVLVVVVVLGGHSLSIDRSI